MQESHESLCIMPCNSIIHVLCVFCIQIFESLKAFLFDKHEPSHRDISTCRQCCVLLLFIKDFMMYFLTVCRCVKYLHYNELELCGLWPQQKKKVDLATRRQC